MRVFLDSNVIFSAVYAAHGVPGQILASAAQGRFQAVASLDVLTESTRNLRMKAPSRLEALADMLSRLSLEIVEPSDGRIIALEESGFGSDAAIAAAAIDGGVDVFCTGDRRLAARVRAAPPGLRVLTPRELLDELASA